MSASARILVVESNTDTRFAVSLILAGEGYEVEVAATKDEAINLCREKDFHLLVGDLDLPNGAGFELLRSIASHCPSKTIAYTGYGQQGVIDVPVGDSVLERKPIVATSLLRAVAHELEISRISSMPRKL
jgi:CheY-like chemotaxis protein